MPPTIFTLGYEKRDIEEYVELLRDHEIDVLIDVRETAWSHKPGFSKGALSDAVSSVGIEYIHAQFAGNPKWLRSEATSHAECLEWYSRYVRDHDEILEALERLLAELIADGKRPCLTCFERHPSDCHRGILAESWRQRGRRRVTHLAPDGCSRLVPA